LEATSDLLHNISALNPTQTQYQSLDEISKSWDQTGRGLTETGTAVVAVAAVAATIATAGAAGVVVAGAAGMTTAADGATVTAATLTTGGMMVAAGTAVAITTAAATFAVSATNASLNADNLGNIDDVAKTSVKETTSKESLKNIAIASVTAALTAGIAEASGLNNAVRTANAAGTTTTTATQMKIALAESAISNTTSTLVQSAISNDSSSDMIKNLATNIAIGAFSNIAAKNIGSAAYAGDISKPEQLLLHAGLGATTAALTGNDVLSGAVSGVVGEMTAEFADKNTNLSDSAIKELAGVAGGLSSIITGEFSGQNDHEVAQNIWSGSRIGKNAAENNYLSPKEKGDLVKELKACNGDQSCQTQVQAKYEAVSKPRDEKLDNYLKQCASFGNCEKLDKISDQLRAEVTADGNKYYQNHKDEFVLLPQELSIWHNMPTDSSGNIMLSAQNENQKYIHPILGYEVVIDGKESIVTNPLNVGTYNFYNPAGYGYPNELITNDNYHAKYDVVPYFLRGNSSNDPSSFLERVKRWSSIDSKK
jgi:hypothetical protein